jgi:hypothetical protein
MPHLQRRSQEGSKAGVILEDSSLFLLLCCVFLPVLMQFT